MTKIDVNEVKAKAEPLKEKFNALDKKVKGAIIAGAVAFLGLFLLGSSNNSKRVEELIRAEMNNPQMQEAMAGGLIEIEIHKLSCSSTRDNRVKNEAYSCDFSATMKENFLGTTEKTDVTLIVDYDPKADEIIETYE